MTIIKKNRYEKLKVKKAGCRTGLFEFTLNINVRKEQIKDIKRKR